MNWASTQLAKGANRANVSKVVQAVGSLGSLPAAAAKSGAFQALEQDSSDLRGLAHTPQPPSAKPVASSNSCALGPPNSWGEQHRWSHDAADLTPPKRPQSSWRSTAIEPGPSPGPGKGALAAPCPKRARCASSESSARSRASLHRQPDHPRKGHNGRGAFRALPISASSGTWSGERQTGKELRRRGEDGGRRVWGEIG